MYLCPSSLSALETFEIINNRQDLSEETYPPIADEEKEGGNLIRQNLNIFQSLFIREEHCESPTRSRQEFLNDENIKDQEQQQKENEQPIESQENNPQRQQQQQDNNEDDSDDDSDKEEEEIKNENKETPQKEEEKENKVNENLTLSPNIKPKLEPLQPRNVPIISGDENNTESNGLTRNKLVLPPPRRLYKKHDNPPKPALNPDLLLSPPSLKLN